MDHWSQKYIGLRYVEGKFDCADMARLVNREVFGREISLPQDRDYMGLDGMAKLRAMTSQIVERKGAYVTPTDAPAEGDGVLILSRGQAAHIGIYALIAGEAWVLHAASDAMQVVLHRIRDLARTGYSVQGFYKWTA